MSLPDNVTFVIDRLRAGGFSACVVGGCVRNFLIGREIVDYDLTTSATPAEMKEVFSDCRTIETGIKHGTLTVCIDGVPCEITTYRTDGDYKDNRHPESVSFTRTLSEDLGRRDFTVNAICYDPYVGYVDLFGGMEDLRLGIIRAVGDARRRFDEDALRIMRAVRFSSVLGFGIERDTAAAIHEKRNLLKNIAVERIFSEFMKLLSGKDAYSVLEEYGDVIKVFLPELYKLKLPKREGFDKADAICRLLSVFYESSTRPAADFERAMRRLKSDNLTRTGGYDILSAIDEVDFTDEKSVLRSLMRYGAETVRGALSLGEALGKFGGREKNLLNSALSSGIPYTLSSLNIRGGDIAALGYRGEKIGECLVFLLMSVIEGKCENEKSALLAFLSDNTR